MTVILEEIFKLKDSDYKKFQSSLIPTINKNTVIGVRVPALRKLAKELWKNREADGNLINEFLNSLPHQYYEENLLHGFLLELDKDYKTVVHKVDEFLPFVDNWAVCDTCHPKVFKKNTADLLLWIQKWIESGKTYSIRFAVGMLMSFYLDENFDSSFCDIVAEIRSEEYYVNMMRAWYFATALAKQWNSTITYIENKKLDVWTHNKSIQKSIESFRVSDEHKNYLRQLKIKMEK